MNQRKLSPVAALCFFLASWGVFWLADFGSAGIENNAGSTADRLPSLAANAEAADTPRARAMGSFTIGAADVTVAAQTAAEMAADTTAAPDEPPVVATSSSDSPQMSPPETPPPVQLAMASPTDVLPGESGRAVSSIEIPDECLVVDPCIDRYLWALYERTPKEDTIKVEERRKVTVKRKGKTVTVTRSFTRLVDEDFGWKDPKAAEKTGRTMMDYVIGGMDRGFKLKLFHALHAAEEAGLSPGITSAFRDDYRQSIASGLKAASDRSYHGGSSRGGYGHGLAADIVSVKGATRDQRWTASEQLWNWIDAHGKEFGVGRPYLDRDPPHVAPVDGNEYASHHGATKSRHAAARIKKHTHLAARNDHRVAKRPPPRSSKVSNAQPRFNRASGTTRPRLQG